MSLLKYFALVCLLAPSNLFAQNRLAKKADSLYRAKSFDKAAGLYTISTADDEFRTSKMSHYYNAACCYSMAGKPDSAIMLLKLAVANGYKNAAHLKKDSDLEILHNLPEWAKIVNGVDKIKTGTSDPRKAKLITSDIKNFWKAHDLAEKDTANRLNIYKKVYIDPGTEGLQDYFAYKVGSIKYFVSAHDKKKKFYAAIRRNTLGVDKQKQQMIASFVKLKDLYQAATFPDIYFLIGAYTSGGTSTSNGLLIGTDQSAYTPDVPISELTLWERNNATSPNDIPYLIAHELIHFNQDGMGQDTTLLKAAMGEGMADFIGELISGQNANPRLHHWAKGREKQVWVDFEKEMYLKRASNWIGNSEQETADRPADLGYWVGYQICKAYYDQSTDKKQAVSDMLNVKDYKVFYEKSKASKLF